MELIDMCEEIGYGVSVKYDKEDLHTIKSWHGLARLNGPW